MALFAAVIGCAPPPPSEATVAQAELNFASQEKLTSHWVKHRGEFESGLTEKQYLENARKFFNSESPSKELKSRGNGDELHYLPSSNEFGVLSEDDTIRTYFKPSSGRRYWDRQ